PLSGESGDGAAAIDAPHAVVVAVADVYVAAGVYRDSRGRTKRGLGGRSAVAAEGVRAVARNRDNRARGAHAPDALASLLGDIEKARGIHGHPDRHVETAGGGRSTVGEGSAAVAAGYR